MTIDLRVVRTALLLAAAILFFSGAGLGVEHERKTLIVWGVGFGLVTLDRLIVLAIETFWVDERARARRRRARRSAKHALAHCSAASTSRPQSMSSSCASSGSCSGETSIRTWFSDASLSSPISCRSSATIATSPTLGRSVLASSSISAGVAPRPAKTPKFTRTSTPGGSTSRTQNAICGSTLIASRIPLGRET